MSHWLPSLRREHTARTFMETEALADPFEQFRVWLQEAHDAGITQPNAMTLGTMGEDGHPDARVVLLKGLDDRGLVFYTHRTSAKGRQLARHPYAAATFLWDPVDRQVRVRGHVEWTSSIESDEYFASRPRGSQLGAIVSNQSEVIPGRVALEQALDALTAQAGDAPLDRPETWGGYRIVPSEFEFWQGRPNRLHDRIRYRRDENGNWVKERLAP